MGQYKDRHYETALHQQLERYGLSTKTWELCYDCAEALKEFMKGSSENGD